MPNPILIVHGWNDTSVSFKRLKEKLSDEFDVEAKELPLADWLSREDDINYDDLAEAFEKAWTDYKLPRTKNSVDVIIHSTGALLVRHWLVKFCDDPQNPPIGKFIMLAPANFGSPLADMGRTIIGRARNGFKKGSFETGTKLLKGLEIASPFSWKLAEKDRFGGHAIMYEAGPDGGGIQCSVFVGNEGNLNFIAEFPGSDGTVRTSTANMNCRKLEAFFSDRPESNEREIPFAPISSTGETAYRLYNNLNHSQASLSDESYKDAPKRIKAIMDELLEDVIEALEISNSAEFSQWIERSKIVTNTVIEEGNHQGDNERHGYQNTVVRVIDTQGNPPDDYALEIYDDNDFRVDGGLIQRGMSATRLIQKHAIDDIHVYADENTYRCFHINCKKFRQKVVGKVKDDLRISITAEPTLTHDQKVVKPGNLSERNNENSVGYYSMEDEDIGYIRVSNEQVREDLFLDHTTLLLDLKIQRSQLDDTVRFTGK